MRMVWLGFEMQRRPEPGLSPLLLTKGEGFRFWQDQELKLKNSNKEGT
jgi:hypothetical protein